MALSVDVERERPVLHVAGDLDHVTAPALAAAIQSQIDDGRRHVVLDLEGLTFMDSSGLGLFVSHHKTLRGLGGGLCLVSAPSRVRAALAITGLDQIFHVYPSVGAALTHRDRTDGGIV